jgi:hypothetical protein
MNHDSNTEMMSRQARMRDAELRLTERAGLLETERQKRSFGVSAVPRRWGRNTVR